MNKEEPVLIVIMVVAALFILFCFLAVAYWTVQGVIWVNLYVWQPFMDRWLKTDE